MNEQMSIFDMLYPDPIDPLRELIRSTEPYWVYSRKRLIEIYRENPDTMDLRRLAQACRQQYCTYGERGHYKDDKEPNALQSWDMKKDTINISYNDSQGKKHERIYSWEDFARELVDMIWTGEYTEGETWKAN